MKVPMLDLRVQLQEIGPAIKEAALGVIDSTAYINGPDVAALETEVAEYIGAKHAIGVSSGTDALLVSLMALGIGPGDIVLTTTYSFFATAGAVARLGAEPVFLDIDPNTYNLDPEEIAAWFVEHTARAERVKAMLVVHLFGQCADMDPILAIANERDIPVIEDAAQAIGSSYPTGGSAAKAGTLGNFGTFSFFPSKNLGGIGDGGLVTTNDDDGAERVRRLRAHGAKPKYYHSMIGGNFRLDTIQAAVLRVKLQHLEKWHQSRRENAAHYDELFADVDGIRTLPIAYGRDNHIYNQYVIEVAGDRDGVRTALQDAGIGTAIFYPVPFHLQQCFESLGYNKGDLPRSEYAADHSLALPVYPGLTREMQDYVAEHIRKAL